MTDPLKQTPEPQRELFDAFCKVAHGFSAEQVAGAAVNLVVNALRQSHPTLRGATGSFDQIVERTRAMIASHYDGLGKRRNVFPFHQIIEVPHLDMRRKQ